MIEFLCPKGHRIRCPEERAGQPAKCPKCGVKFRVPEASQGDKSASSSSSGSIPKPTGGSGNGPATAEEQIEFLCPNGHRLHGPSSLQGRPGQCPECGSRFRIPSYDEVPDSEEEGLDDEIGVVSGGSDTKAAFEDTGESEDDGQSSYDLGADGSAASERLDDGSGNATRSGKAHPLAEAFGKLWSEKPPEAVVEIHIADGEKLTPDHFAKNASQGTHGVFAVEDSSGRYTVTLIAWESIARVELRGVKRLPDWMRI